MILYFIVQDDKIIGHNVCTSRTLIVAPFKEPNLISGASRSPPTELMLDSSKWLVNAAARFAAYEFIRNIKKVHQEKVRILDERHLQDSCWKRYKMFEYTSVFLHCLVQARRKGSESEKKSPLVHYSVWSGTPLWQWQLSLLPVNKSKLQWTLATEMKTMKILIPWKHHFEIKSFSYM